MMCINFLRVLFATLLLPLFTSINANNVDIYSLFSGYRGRRAADYAYKNVNRCILEHPELNKFNLRGGHPNKLICNVLAESLFKLDEEILDPYSSYKPIQSGSSGTVLVVDKENRRLYAANVGSSKIVFGLKEQLKEETKEDIAQAEFIANIGRDEAIKRIKRPSHYYLQLNIENMENYKLQALQGNAFQPLNQHEPGDILEFKRILKAGGYVKYFQGRYRIQGFLPTSRSFGNRRYKILRDIDRQWISDNPDYYNSKTHCAAANISFPDQIITKDLAPCNPDIWTGRLNENYYFAILASDSIWDLISNTEAVNIVGNSLIKHHDPKVACQELINVAKNRGSGPMGHLDHPDALIIVFEK